MTVEHKPSHPHAQQPPAAAGGAPESEPLDISEKGGAKNGVPQKLDRRLFMQLQAFGGCPDARGLGEALGKTGVASVVYEDASDPRGVAVLTMSDDPADFLTKVRPVLGRESLILKPEFTMLGRTYSLGYEPNLEDWLLHRPKRVACAPETPWAVWYPLRRTGAFSQLPRTEQMQILKEHGIIGRRFGDAGLATDIRLACHGMDKNDNDFVIGLIGKDLHPLSALVETMRPTQQTSKYIAHMGPFFVGRVAWASKAA